ncbi:GPI mannosyltransferase 4 [Odocoileus virginianus]|uniref:Mannosyltransferase n=1 Tax=Odocoileus virginianus TaxID=9874 RepID=A0ABM4I397_ODOVR
MEMAARVLWGSLGLLRLVWCLLPQTGYVHPDEFFQSPEVMAEDVLGVEAARPWEFHPSSPCRTVVFPLLTSGSAFWLLRLWEEWGPWPGAVSGYALLVGPRLLLTTLSFALDLAVYHLAPAWGAERWNALLLLSGSYVTLVFYTRTFSNAIEGLLFAWLLVLVSPGLARSSTPRKPTPGPQWHGWLLGGLVVAGFFNRPTFLAFALVPLFLWGTCGATDPSFKSLTRHARVLLPGASLTAVAFVAADSWYFSSPSRPSTLVLTPVNFLHYNLDPVNLARHGTHVRLTHLAVNGFLLFGALHAHTLRAAWQQLRAGLRACAQMGFPRALGAWSPRPSPRSLLLLFYFMPLTLLSAFSHQEARFLIPLLVPLVLLCSLQTQPAPYRGTLALFNILGALFFGCLHQGGLVPGLGHLERVVHAPEPLRVPTHFTLVFTHTYMPPRHLLHLPGLGLGLSVDVVDMGGAEDGVLCQALNNFTRHPSCQAAGGPWLCRLFVVTPGTTRPAVRKCHFPLRSEMLIFPHLTLEDPPALSSLLSRAWRDHLSLHILELGEKPDNMTQKPLPKTAVGEGPIPPLSVGWTGTEP